MNAFSTGLTPPGPSRADREVLVASRSLGADLRQSDLSVPGIRCGGCIRAVETALGKLGGVVSARVNLSTKRATVVWRAPVPPPLLEALEAVGFEAHVTGPPPARDQALSSLLRALAVSGFATVNIMSFSVAVWSGAEPATRDLFHWISALVALPAVAYAGRVFFRPAWRSLSRGRLNMDVPISLGVLLTFAMSFYQTTAGAEYVYFDAAVSLLFVLLIGRTLDHVMRERARSAATELAGLIDHGATTVLPDGSTAPLQVADLRPGMVLRLAAGERSPVDGRVLAGLSDVDCSLVSGESVPQPVAPGAAVVAGTLNLSSPIEVAVTSSAQDSFLAEITRLMEVAEAGRSGYRRIADRVAGLYAPAVHITALATFTGWMLAGAGLFQSLTIAVAVLIITCPCALGLAVPMVQVVAAQRLFASGVLVKDGGVLEKLNEVDTIVFDKTGTLTSGRLQLADPRAVDSDALTTAAAMGAHSRHPHARALAKLKPGAGGARGFDRVEEHPGLGIEARTGSHVYRLGRREWAVGDAAAGAATDHGTGTALSSNGHLVQQFRFEDPLRPGAREIVGQLLRSRYQVELLSGDRSAAVDALARSVGISSFRAELLPGDKTRHVAELGAAGRKVLMVGDGLNDAPALAAAHVSMAPAGAADVSRSAAGLVFLRESLEAVPLAIRVAGQAHRLIRQNFALALAYNVVAVPFAVAGQVTPLIAAVAMSLSSLTVVANAMRLRGISHPPRPAGADTPAEARAGQNDHLEARAV